MFAPSFFVRMDKLLNAGRALAAGAARPDLRTAAAALLLALLAAEDRRSMQLPDSLSFCLLALGLADPHPLAFCTVTALWLLMLLLCAAADRELPIGLGDCRLFSALAFGFGAERLLGTLAAASVSAGLYAAVCLLLGTKRGTDRFPLVPFLFFGFLFCSYSCSPM